MTTAMTIRTINACTTTDGRKTEVNDGVAGERNYTVPTIRRVIKICDGGMDTRRANQLPQR